MSPPIQKVLFIEPRAPRPHIFSRMAIPRLGPVLLGTILERQGLEVKVIIEEISAPDYRSLDFHPDLVCISTITSTAPLAYELGDYYRGQGIPVVMGGAHPSFVVRESLDHADYVICGEGDEALPELVAALNSGGDLGAVKNLAFLEGETLRQNPWRPFVENLDDLPIPNYEVVHGWSARRGHRIVSIATSRGCPFNCRFCGVIRLFGRKYRFNSVDRVMQEIRQNGLKAHHVFFCDDNFTADRERIKKLCQRILQEKLNFEWSAQVRVEAAKDEELMQLMARTGCYCVFVGLESINPATLKLYNKSQTVEGIKDCVINFHRHGIRVHGMFVFGSEEDHYQVIRDTVKFSRDLDLDSLQYLILTPIPGTPVYQELEAQNRIFCRDWSHYDGHHAVFQPRQLTAYELQWETIRAMKKFYSWPSVVKRIIARDWFYVKMKAWGRIQMWQARWGKSNHVLHLKERLFSRVRLLRHLLPGGNYVPRVGIPADIWNLGPWENSHREFLLRFLRRLGVEVVQESMPEKADTGPIKMVQTEIARLQEKADLILLPLWQGLEEARLKIKDAHQQITQETVARLLTLEFSRESFYNACMELGLCFRKRMRRIRRVYFQTLAEVGTPI